MKYVSNGRNRSVACRDGPVMESVPQSRRRFRDCAVSLFFALVVLAAGCGEKTSTGPDGVDQVVAVNVVSPIDSVMAVGRTIQLMASALDAAGNAVGGATISWSSSNSSVAGVTSSGVVDAQNAGTTTVTATSGEASGQLLMRTVDADLVGVGTALNDAFVAQMSGGLESTTGANVSNALSECNAALVDGNVLVLNNCLTSLRNESGTGSATDRALLAVLVFFFDHADRLLNFGR